MSEEIISKIDETIKVLTNVKTLILTKSKALESIINLVKPLIPKPPELKPAKAYTDKKPPSDTAPQQVPTKK